MFHLLIFHQLSPASKSITFLCRSWWSLPEVSWEPSLRNKKATLKKKFIINMYLEWGERSKTNIVIWEVKIQRFRITYTSNRRGWLFCFKSLACLRDFLYGIPHVWSENIWIFKIIKCVVNLWPIINSLELHPKLTTWTSKTEALAPQTAIHIKEAKGLKNAHHLGTLWPF